MIKVRNELKNFDKCWMLNIQTLKTLIKDIIVRSYLNYTAAYKVTNEVNFDLVSNNYFSQPIEATYRRYFVY